MALLALQGQVHGESLVFDNIPRLAAPLRCLSSTVPRMRSIDKLESLEWFWKQIVVRLLQ